MRHTIIYTFLLFLFDRLLKVYAISNPSELFVYKGVLGWEYYANPGITFGVGIPIMILQIATPFLLLFLYLFIKNREKKYFFPFLLVFFGALSNYIDRIIYEITIDYIRIFSGIANIADFMIFFGIICIILFSNKDES